MSVLYLVLVLLFSLQSSFLYKIISVILTSYYYFYFLRLKSKEVVSLLGVSESTTERGMKLLLGKDIQILMMKLWIVSSKDGLMREFPNCDTDKRLTGLLVHAAHRIQHNRTREYTRRVNPESVLLRSLELQTLRSEEHISSSALLR